MSRDEIISTLRQALPALERDFPLRSLALFRSAARGDARPPSPNDNPRAATPPPAPPPPRPPPPGPPPPRKRHRHPRRVHARLGRHALHAFPPAHPPPVARRPPRRPHREPRRPLSGL